jgi:hypothetical protein
LGMAFLLLGLVSCFPDGREDEARRELEGNLGAGGVAQVVECLHSKGEALCSNPGTTKKKRELDPLRLLHPHLPPLSALESMCSCLLFQSCSNSSGTDCAPQRRPVLISMAGTRRPFT